jgi:UDP-2-acetamido-3-amino-2,3-dideoxy-glucuronate N-acetyltransferase
LILPPTFSEAILQPLTFYVFASNLKRSDPHPSNVLCSCLQPQAKRSSNLQHLFHGVSLKFLSIAPDVKLGENVRIHNFVNLYGCEIGDDTKIGVFVEVQKNARIGKCCKISSHTFICEGVTIEDNVFIGHSVVFINDPYPRATNPNGELQTDADWKVEPILVKKGASIGSNATILSHVTIGENAIIGAGSVVTRDVPPNMIVAGNPARLFRPIDFLSRADAAEQRVLYEFLQEKGR